MALVMAAGMAFAQGAGTGTTQPRGQRHVDRLAIILGLSDAQKAQVQTIFSNTASQTKALFPQLKQNRQAIQQLVESGNTQDFDQQLQTLASTQGSLTSQVVALRAKAMAQVWNLLTPDQRTKAQQLHALLGGGFGMGAGPMGGGRMGMNAHRGARPGSAQ